MKFEPLYFFRKRPGIHKRQMTMNTSQVSAFQVENVSGQFIGSGQFNDAIIALTAPGTQTLLKQFPDGTQNFRKSLRF
jgi:hypothetical protein